MGLKPFFTTYPTDKELALCKLCLNVKMLLEPLMSRAKKDNYETYDSATSSFMWKCKC